MLWRVDPSSPVPLFEQLASSVRRAILDGDLQPGERLPSAKEVARSLEVNMHTVLRAYQILRDEGLVDLRRGRGAVVVHTDPGLLAFVARVDQLLVDAARLGLSPREVSALIEARP